MRILVIHASHYGQTRKIAMQLAQHLRDQGHEVEIADARAAPRALPPPDDYDIVVIGSRVEAGKHASEIRAYIRNNLDALRERPTAFFSVSMSAARADAGNDPSGYLHATFEELDWHPTRSIAFAGGLPYLKYGWFMRFVMKRISLSGGHSTDTSRNHELTDWDAVRRFAHDVARLRPASEPAVTRV